MKSVKVITGDQERDIKVTSIILEADPLNPDAFILFFCPRCRMGLFQYSGSIVMITPGPTKSILPLIHQCKTCKTKYLINSIL